MDRDRIWKVLKRKAYYLIQKTTGFRYDTDLERKIARKAEVYLSKGDFEPRIWDGLRRIETADINLTNHARYALVRDDIYFRFLPDDKGENRDHFGRTGSWIPRGCKVYFDAKTRDYVKLFDRYFCNKGEGRFLSEALQSGVYDFLCPNLSYLIQDSDGTLRGYAIAEGEPLTSYEFERFIGTAYRDVICDVTERTRFYFNDLEFHNVVRNGVRLSLIDLESVLPLNWFGTDLEFARRHLTEVDIGWPIQDKWESPRWYKQFLKDLMTESSSTPG